MNNNNVSKDYVIPCFDWYIQLGYTPAHNLHNRKIQT